MEKRLKFKFIFLFYSLIYLAAFCFFYYKYVPLVKSFQIALLPILFVMLILTAANLRWGILFFVFAFPLINNLPYFFGIYENVPHAPTSLVLFLTFLLGWLLNNIFHYSKMKFNHSIFKPIILLSLIILVSGIVTFFRYINFFPFLSNKVYELAVNVNLVRAGGALMSDIFNSLNYLTGFIFFAIIFNTIKSKEFIKKLLLTLSISFFISLSFSFVQKYHSISLGNTPFWVEANQINASFKDPNTFAICLSAFLPVLLGMFFSFGNKLKPFFLFSIILALIIFPSTGSRSVLLALIILCVIIYLLFLFSHRISKKKKLIYSISLLLIISIVSLSILFLSTQSNLYKRLDSSLAILANGGSLDQLSNGKVVLWTVAYKMMKDYPLTGVGLGSYIIELPNYLRSMKLPTQSTDSAENYFLQAGSELGLIGFFLFLWIFFEILRQMRRSWKEIATENKDKFILIGATGGIVVVFVNYLFHSYVGSFEVAYTFWILVVLIFVLPQPSGSSKVKLNRKINIFAIILLIVFGSVHLWNSTHSLSINYRTENYGWTQDFGVYEPEKDNRGLSFRWANKIAGITVENLGNIIVIPMVASHPDLREKPVKVMIFLADHNFRKKKLIKEIIFKEKEWINVECPILSSSEKNVHLVFETSRGWKPLKYLGVPDQRTLAIGLGEEWFKYQGEISKQNIKGIEKISYEAWQGRFKNYLVGNGTSHIKIETKETKVTLRLWIRGEKAINVGPYLIIRLDDSIIGKTMLTEDSWTPLIFNLNISKGEHILYVDFINDYYNPALGQDRNVMLGDIDVIYLK